MVWPFGRKEKQAKQQAEKTMKDWQAQAAVSDRHLAEHEKFKRSAAGKTLKRHFELSERLRTAPASRQEAIALELVSFAGDAAKAWREQEKLWERQSRESKDRTRYEPVMVSHAGFDRLAINYERDKRFEDAIAVCQEAKRQGWNGDWDKRIERCQAKLLKQKG